MIEKIKALLGHHRGLKKQRLSFRLLLWVVICSSFFALLVSVFQLYTDYKRDVASIHSSMQFINDSYLKSLAVNAYNMDLQQLELQLQGMLTLQDIEFLEIIEKSENSNNILARTGDPNSSKDIEREFTLNYFPTHLPLELVQFSVLRVSASLEGVYQRLWDKAIIIIISNITKTFLASIFIFFIFQFLITRHLISMAKFTKQLNIENLGVPLVLDRKSSDITKQDELDQLVNAINSMQKKLVADIDEIKLAEDALIDSEDRFRTVSKLSNDILWEWHIVEGIVNWFGNIDGQLGYEENEIPRTLDAWKKIIHPEDIDHVEKSLHKSLEVRAPWYEEYRAITKGGEIQYWVDRGEVRTEIDGRQLIMSGAITDITDRKRAEANLKKSEERFRKYFELGLIGMAKTSLDKGWLELNDTLCKMFGYSREELSKLSWTELTHPEDLAADLAYFNKILAGEIDDYSMEKRFFHKDGSIIFTIISVSVVRDADNSIDHFIAHVADISELKHADEQITFQASHDALTGLVNRYEFERRAEQMLSISSESEDEHALCFMDLDQFKVVNDTCGHVAGDEMLRQLSTALQDAVRHHDTLARLGGDEFGVLMEHCSLDDAHRVATTLQQTIQNYQFAWEGHSFKVGVSMGLVAMTKTTTNLSELLRDADAACYIAKDKGRNRIHVYNEEDSEIAQRHGEMQWITRIQHALDEDKFCLYAQSIVPLDNTTDKHYELLIRMIDNKGEVIPPGAFLPAAERYNLMTQIDCWVIDNVFRLLAENPAFQSQISFISVNLSGQSLADQNILDLIIRRLNETDMKNEKVCFEITETAAISNLNTAKKFISTLKEMGCRFALDDFGSGLSSFAYLKNLPVDYLKIDGMFVKDIVDDPIDRAMVKSINEVGHVMGMQTIAEFVENDEIKGMLREIGVNYAQGYAIHKPQAFDELLSQSVNVTE